MKSNDELFELIKSMSKPEKRFFKIYAGKNSTNYVKLFVAIDKISIYDDKSFRKKYSGEQFLKNFSYNKHYLFKLLLESLNNFNSNKSIDFRIRELISGYETLFRKGLLKQAKKILDKAYSLVKDNEKKFYIMIILANKINLKNMIIDQEERDYYVNDLMKEQSAVLANLKNEIDYYILSTQIMKFMNIKGGARKEEERKEIEAILKNDLLTDDSKPVSIDAKCYYYFIKHLCYLNLENLNKSYYFSRKGVEILDDVDMKLAANRARLRTALGAHLLLLRYFPKKDKEFFDCLKKYRAAIYPERQQLAGRYIDSYNSELLFNIKSGMYEANTKVLTKAAAAINGLKDFKNTGEYYYLASNAAYSEFINSRFDNCQYWINIAMSETISYKAQTHVRLLSLILNYELKNFELLESQMRSTYRYLKSKGRLLKYEKLVLDFIRVSAKNITVNQLLELFERMRIQLIEIIKDKDEKKAFEDVDLVTWLESKIKGIKFIDMLTEKVNTTA